jgi:WD40 repeat protein
VAFCPDGQWLASVGADGLVRISRVPNGEPAATVIRPEPGAMQLAWSPDGRWLLVGGPEGGQLWDARSGTPVTPRIRYPSPVAGATFTPDSQALLVLTEDGRLQRERLDAPDWPDDDWHLVARVFSNREVDRDGGAVPWLALSATNTLADAEKLTARWRQHRPRLRELLAPRRWEPSPE